MKNITDIRNHRKFRGRRLGTSSRRADQTQDLPRLDSLLDFARALFMIFWERPLHSTLEFLGICFAAILLFRVLPFIAEVLLDVAGISAK